MKKLILSIIFVISFLLGNVSMVATIIKLFGKDALLPVAKDLVGQKVDTVLWGAPRRRGTSLQSQYGLDDQFRTQRNLIGGDRNLGASSRPMTYPHG